MKSVRCFLRVAQLDVDESQSKNPRRSQQRVEEAAEMFVRMENWDGLAVIFAQLPSGKVAGFGLGFECDAERPTLFSPLVYGAPAMHPLCCVAQVQEKCQRAHPSRMKSRQKTVKITETIVVGLNDRLL